MSASGDHRPSSGSKPSPAIDGVTAQVLGVADYLSLVTPRSEAAKKRWRQGPERHFLRDSEWSDELARRQALDASMTAEKIAAIDAHLCALPTLRRVFRRLAADEVLDDGDLFELKRFLYHGLALLADVGGDDELPSANSPTAQALEQLMSAIHPESTRSARFRLADQLDPELAKKRRQMRAIRRQLKQRRQALEQEIVDAYGGRFDFHGNYHHPQGSAPDEDRRLKDCGDYYEIVDSELESLAAQLEAARQAVGVEEERQRRRLTQVVGQSRQALQAFKGRLLRFELRLTALELRRQTAGCWPEKSRESSPLLKIVQGRDPALMATMAADEVQPIDLVIDEGATVILGPNMGGKSAVLRLVGLAQWCAQMALPVPAERCQMRPMQRIVYVGSEEPGVVSAASGLSSFGREVRRFVDFWEGPAPTLWLLDEPGRGTHPEEGARLAADIATGRLARGDSVLMATHFPLLARDARFEHLRIAGLVGSDDRLAKSLADAGGDLVGMQRALRRLMDYRVLPAEDHGIPRDARRVARALGLRVGVGDGDDEDRRLDPWQPGEE